MSDNSDTPETIEIIRMSDGSVRVTLIAERCEQGCGERVRYWNDDGGGLGNASCGCCREGAETCDPIAVRPTIVNLLRDALAQVQSI